MPASKRKQLALAAVTAGFLLLLLALFIPKQRIAAHAACRVVLPAPEGAAKWGLRCASWPDVSRIEWTWYLLVRRTGLSRVGFREQPPGVSLCWTQVIQ